MRLPSPFRSVMNAAIVISVCGTVAGAARAQVQSIIRTGDSVSSIGAGITQHRLVNTGVGTFLAPPVVSSQTGELFVTSEIAGPGVYASNRSTIWALPAPGAGTTQLIARAASPGPGLPAGMVFSTLSPPFVDDAGNAAFISSIAGAGVTYLDDTGIWTRAGSNIRLTAREGNAAFGLQDGSVHSDFRDPLIVGEPGPSKLAFGSVLRGPAVNGTNNFAVGGALLSTIGQPHPVLDVRLGDFAPGASDGRFLSIKRQMGPGGRSAYACSLFGTTITTANGHGNWSDRTGSLSMVVRAGDSAPGALPGGVFSTVHTATDLPVVNRAGHIAFYGRVTGSGINWMNDTGIWTDRSGSLQPVFVAGTPVGGYPSGVVFNSFNASSTPMVIHDSGAITASAMLRGSGIIGGTNDRALVRNENGQTTIITASNAGAPGLPAGVRISAVALAPIIRANGAGDLFFPAGVMGAGVSSHNDWAMFAYQDGQLRVVCREGQIIDGWTVSTLRWDKLQVNDAGQAVFVVNGVWSGDAMGMSRPVLLSVDTAGVCRVVAGESATLAIMGAPTVSVQTLAVSNTNALANDGRIVFGARFNAPTTDEAVLAAQIVDGSQPTPCPADYNQSGVVTNQDIFDFLGDWFRGEADFDQSGTTDIQDVFAFLADWFRGCP